MKRTAVLVLTMALIISACIPALPSLQQPDAAPAALDVQSTDEALAATLAVETLNALPTPTLEPATVTTEPTETNVVASTASETATATATETLTPDPNATSTPTGTLETSTSTITATPPTATISPTGTQFTFTPSVTPISTETLHARFYGTLPPSIPSGNVRLINKSKVQVYISMHCTTIDGYTTIIEYPVVGKMKVPAPAGRYSYVAWVGGRQFLGGFNLKKGDLVEITFEKNKVSTK